MKKIVKHTSNQRNVNYSNKIQLSNYQIDNMK